MSVLVHAFKHTYFWLRQELKKCKYPFVCSVKVSLEHTIFIFQPKILHDDFILTITIR